MESEWNRVEKITNNLNNKTMKTLTQLAELLKENGGSIVNTGSLSPESINQAHASERIYVSEDGFGFVWEPDMTKFPTKEKEVEAFERWFPIDMKIPDHLIHPKNMTGKLNISIVNDEVPPPVTQKPEIFTMSDLVTFGEYLLSERRKKSFEENVNFPNHEKIEERMRFVNQADILNWLTEENGRKNTTSIKLRNIEDLKIQFEHMFDLIRAILNKASNE